MVGLGKGIVGTPGGSGGCTGAAAAAAAAGWLASSVIAGPPSMAGDGGVGAADSVGLRSGRVGGAVLRETVEAGFFTEAATRGRAALMDGFAFALPVARPFCFERPLALRSAPLPALRCRSISLTPV